jgi:hypothetical protein
MIVFGSAVTSPEEYALYAERGIERAKEPDSLVLPHQPSGSIHRNYNAIMERVASLEDLEALVLLHQDAEIVDERFCQKLREALRDPDVGVVGCVGALGVRSIAWWEGSVTWASFIHRYTEFGGGDFPSVTWHENERAPYAHLGEVDSVDGFVLGLSPWVVRNIRFDESLGQNLHGYDFDLCLQVRAAGRKIVTADFKVIHNHSLNLASDFGQWSTAHAAVCEKWEGKMPGVGFAGGDWRYRARRAEAEAAITRAVAMSTRMRRTAREMQHERIMAEMKESLSWRLTEPLRRIRTFQRRRTPRAEAAGSDTAAGQSVLGRRIG